MGTIVATKPQHEGAAFVDSRTGVAFLIGSLAGLARIEPALAIIGVIAFEALQEIGAKGGSALTKKQSGESYANQIMDVAATTAGVYLGNYLRDVGDYRIAQQHGPIPAENPAATAGWGAY